MAEFCLACYNKLHGTNYGIYDVELETDLCEGYGEMKPVLIRIGGPSLARICGTFVVSHLGKLWRKIRR